MTDIFTIGLTGGIGSGKTAVSDCFANLDIGIVDADVSARDCVAPGEPALAAIAEHFDNGIIQPDGNLDRAALRQIIFADESKRRWLEEHLHPLIGARIRLGLNAVRSQYAILVSPLLIEARQSVWVHRILVVDAPEEAQILRTMARDNNERAQVERIMAAQMSRADRQAKADDLLINDGNLNELNGKVLALHQKYLQYAQTGCDIK